MQPFSTVARGYLTSPGTFLLTYTPKTPDNMTFVIENLSGRVETTNYDLKGLLIYFFDPDGKYVAQYAPISWLSGGTDVHFGGPTRLYADGGFHIICMASSKSPTRLWSAAYFSGYLQAP